MASSSNVIPREGGESSTPWRLGSKTTATGILDRPVKPGDDSERVDADTPSHPRGVFARALLRHSTLKSKRAQGRPGADLAPAVRCAKSTRRKTAQQHTGGANHSAFPARGRIEEQKAQ
jgi:hypothetical protein